jgi:hypothetical protein
LAFLDRPVERRLELSADGKIQFTLDLDLPTARPDLVLGELERDH